MCIHHLAAVKFLVSRGNDTHLKGGRVTVTHTCTHRHQHTFWWADTSLVSSNPWLKGYLSLDPSQHQKCPQGRMVQIHLPYMCHLYSMAKEAILWGCTLKQPSLYSECAGHLLIGYSEDIDCCNTTGFFSCWHKYSEFPKVPQSNAGMHNRNQVGQWSVAEVMCTTSRPDPSWIGMQSYKREGICVREGQPRQELLTLHELKANCCLMLNQWDLRTS